MGTDQYCGSTEFQLSPLEKPCFNASFLRGIYLFSVVVWCMNIQHFTYTMTDTPGRMAHSSASTANAQPYSNAHEEQSVFELHW